jgi:hypothetical protein
MSVESILAQIDAEIARLTQVRALLASTITVDTASFAGKAKRGPGRPKSAKPRVLSADARKRIADAQRRRWAAQKAKTKKEA